MSDDVQLLGAKQLDAIKELIRRLGAARQAKVPFLDMALSAIEAKDYEQALGMFDRAIALGPHPIDHVLRAQMLTNLDRFAEAKTAINHAVDLDPDDADARKTRARILEHVQDLDGALADFDYVATHLEPNDVTVHVSRGMLLDQLNRSHEALKAFDRAVELDPNDEFVHVSQGIILDRLKRFDEACAAFYRALEIDPDNRTAGYMLESYPRKVRARARKINQESRYVRRYTPEVDKEKRTSTSAREVTIRRHQLPQPPPGLEWPRPRMPGVPEDQRQDDDYDRSLHFNKKGGARRYLEDETVWGPARLRRMNMPAMRKYWPSAARAVENIRSELPKHMRPALKEEMIDRELQSEWVRWSDVHRLTQAKRRRRVKAQATLSL